VSTVEVAAAPRRVRSRRGEGDKLREDILEAAEKMLIATKDQSSLSIRAIANAVGVTPPSIYLHFSDRNELLFAVCERQGEHIEKAMEAAAAGISDPWERLRRRGRAYLEWGLANPEHYRILMMSHSDATPERFTDERLAGMAGLQAVASDLSVGVEAGRFAPAGDVLGVSELLWMVVHGMVSLLICKPEFPFGSPEDVFEGMFQLLYRGISAGNDGFPQEAHLVEGTCVPGRDSSGVGRSDTDTRSERTK
jgi:AcrR family transcriptional regulator